MHSRVRLAALALTAVAGLALVTACGSADESAAPTEQPASAAPASEAPASTVPAAPRPERFVSWYRSEPAELVAMRADGQALRAALDPLRPGDNAGLAAFGRAMEKLAGSYDALVKAIPPGDPIADEAIQAYSGCAVGYHRNAFAITSIGMMSNDLPADMAACTSATTTMKAHIDAA